MTSGPETPVAPQTRAVSEDGRWEVVLDPMRGEWAVWERNQNPIIRVYGWLRGYIADTGQDAQEVLAQWQSERG